METTDEETGLDVLDLRTDAVFATRNLHTRNIGTQMAGLQRLSQALLERPDTILQELVSAAVDLCGADSAGISIEKDGGTDQEFWHWIAVAGVYSSFLNAVLPRYPSACGVCLERRHAQHFTVSKKFFDILGIEAPLVTDGILLPWETQYTRGTIFVMAHGRTAAFDKNDAHLMTMLADFAAMGYRQQKLAQLDRKRIEEETSRLNRATEMGQLLAHLAHELAQPLAAVLSNAQAASRLSARPNPDLAEIQKALSDIIEDDQRANAVLGNVRALLRKHSITPHRVNLNEIVKSVTLMVKSSAQLRGIQLWSFLSEDVVLVMGDEVPLQQVLLNLINNAMDAVIQLPTERRTITLTTALQIHDGSGILTVEDQGPGIPDDIKAKLFQPFFTTKDGGLGMGLAICQTILETLGGSIQLQDKPGRGATFQVVLCPAP
jgi:signal transduction histidine kinase